MIGKYNLLQIAQFAFVSFSAWSIHCQSSGYRAGCGMRARRWRCIISDDHRRERDPRRDLMLAARDPVVNASLIWFTMVPTVVRALVMMIQAAGDPMQHGHLVGDVPSLLIATIVLGRLMLIQGRRDNA